MPRAVVASEASRWWLSWRSFSPSPSAARSQAWHSQGTQNDRSCISGGWDGKWPGAGSGGRRDADVERDGFG